MAFNWQTFKTRTITSIVFAAVMLTGLLWNRWSFFILFSIIHFGCWWEYQKLIGLIDRGYQEINSLHKYGIMFTGWCMVLFLGNFPFEISNIYLSELGFWIAVFLFFAIFFIELTISKKGNAKNIGYSFLGIIYISLSCGLMINLRKNNFDVAFVAVPLWVKLIIPCTVIFTIWINDTMAYIVGSLIGKTSLSKISPKKTWEGAIGGILICVSIPFWIGYKSLGYIEIFPMIDRIMIVLITCIAGTFGDLLESKLKRMANVKDSGRFMPGFGGFLDRFDSMLLAIPVVWLYVYFFMR